MSEVSAYDSLPPKQRRFVDLYVGRCRLNAVRAYIAAGYSKKSAQANAYRMMENDGVRKAISERLKKKAMTDDEAAFILAEHARGSLREFVRRGAGGRLVLDTTKPGLERHMHLVKKWKQKERIIKSLGGGGGLPGAGREEEEGEEEIQLVEIETEVELYDAQAAARDIRRAHGAYGAKGTEDDPNITEIRLTYGPPPPAEDGPAEEADGSR